MATEALATAAPLLITYSAVEEAKKTSRQVFIESLKSLYDIAEGQLYHVTGSVRDIVKTTPGVIRALTTTSRRALAEISRISRISINTFYRVVEKATGTPESIITAIVMYRLVDYAVNIDADSVSKFMDDLRTAVEKITFKIEHVTMPRVSLREISTKTAEYMDRVKQELIIRKEYIKDPEPPQPPVVCGEAPSPIDIPAYVAWAFCKLGEVIIHGLSTLGYYVVKALVSLVKLALDFIIYMLDFTKTVTAKLIELAEWIINGLISIIEHLLNGLIWIVNNIINLVLNYIVKPVALLTINYVVKPLAIFIINAYNWIKEQMKTILCWYLKTAPFLVGFRWMYTYMRKQGEKGLFLSPRELLIKPLSILAASSIAVSIILAILVPECSLIPGAVAVEPAPPPPTTQAIETPPITHISTVTLKLASHETTTYIVPLIHTGKVAIKTTTAERTALRVAETHTAYVKIKTQVEETTTTPPALLHYSRVVVKLQVEE